MSNFRCKNLSEEIYSELEETFSYDFSSSEDSGSDVLNQAYIETPPYDKENEKLDFPIEKLDESKLELPDRHYNTLKPSLVSPREILTEESNNTAVKAKYSNQFSIEKKDDTRKPQSPLTYSGNLPDLKIPPLRRSPLGTFFTPYSVPGSDININDAHLIKPQSLSSEKVFVQSATAYCPHLSKRVHLSELESTASVKCDICIADKENEFSNDYSSEIIHTKPKNDGNNILSKYMASGYDHSVQKSSQKLPKNYLEHVSPSISTTVKKVESSVLDANLVAVKTVPLSNHEKLNLNMNLLNGKQEAIVDVSFITQENIGVLNINKISKGKQFLQESSSKNVSNEEQQHSSDSYSSDSEESTENSFDSEVIRQLKFQQVLSRKYYQTDSNKDTKPATVPLNNIVERGMGVKKHIYHYDLSTIYEVDSALTDGSSRQSKSTSLSSKGSWHSSLQNELNIKISEENLAISPRRFKMHSLTDSLDSEISELEKDTLYKHTSVPNSKLNLIYPKPSYSTPKSEFLPKEIESIYLERPTKGKYMSPPTARKLKSSKHENTACPGDVIDKISENIRSEKQTENALQFNVNDPSIYASDINQNNTKLMPDVNDGISNIQQPLLKLADIIKNVQASLVNSKGNKDNLKSSSYSTKIDEVNGTRHSNLKSYCYSSDSIKLDRPNLKLIKVPDNLKGFPSFSSIDSMSDTSSCVNSPVKSVPIKSAPVNYRRVEESIQEKGILEESDLTLVPASLMTIHEESQCRAVTDSPSLISFLQHERSCMLSDKTETSLFHTEYNIPTTTTTKRPPLPVKRGNMTSKFPRVKYKEHTKRLWNNLEEVKKKRNAEELKEVAAINRLKAKEFAKNLTPKKKRK